ncbi:MAG: transposase Orf2 like protein [Variovorax sp.]|nr:transposase Orf2 like protein [Variovorax sp.]
MSRFNEDLKVYLHRKAIDFRVGLNGLAILVEQALGLDPFALFKKLPLAQTADDYEALLAWRRTQ